MNRTGSNTTLYCTVLLTQLINKLSTCNLQCWHWFCVDCCRENVIARFERCRAQFDDVSSMWFAAESSVQLIGHASSKLTQRSARTVESGIDTASSFWSLPATQPHKLAEPAVSADNDTGINSPTTAEPAVNSQSPEVKLGRLERLKDHIVKYILRFKPDRLTVHHQCICETERW